MRPGHESRLCYTGGGGVMERYMMKCGHVAQAMDEHNNPACVICWPNPGSMQVASIPDLSSRKAECSTCRTNIVPSSVDLAFFEYKGPGSRYALTKCVFGYYEEAHGKPKNPHVEVCNQFRPVGQAEFDVYYCGCQGW